MSGLLLDTHALLWLYKGDEQLGPAARLAIETTEMLAVSVVSLWEIALKSSSGKLTAAVGTVTDRVRSDGLVRVPIEDEHLATLAALPWPDSGHRDPFDRLLVSQAEIEGLTLVTADRQLGWYKIPILDARS